jgi:type I restriction enzyme M protein
MLKQADVRHERSENDRPKAFPTTTFKTRQSKSRYFWLRDESLEASANLLDPDVLALEIAEELKAALEQFAAIAEDLKR